MGAWAGTPNYLWMGLLVTLLSEEWSWGGRRGELC